VDQAHATFWSADSGARRPAITANTVLLGALLGAVAAAVAVAVARSGVTGLDLDRHRGPLLVALAAIPLSMTVLYLTTVLVLDARVRAVDTAMLLGALLQCGGLLGLAALGRADGRRVVWIWAASAGLPLLVMLSAARPPLAPGDPRLAGRSVRLGLRYHAGSASLYLTYRVDVLILGAMASTTAIGRYTLAVTLAELIRIPTDAYARNSLAGQMAGDLAQAAAVTVRASRVSVLVAGGSVAGLCLAAPVLVPLAYGARFAERCRPCSRWRRGCSRSGRGGR